MPNLKNTEVRSWLYTMLELMAEHKGGTPRLSGRGPPLQNSSRGHSIVALFLAAWWLDALTTILTIEHIGWGMESGPVTVAVMDLWWSAPELIDYHVPVVTAGLFTVASIKTIVPVALGAIWRRSGLEHYWWARWWLLGLAIAGGVIGLLNLVVLAGFRGWI